MSLTLTDYSVLSRNSFRLNHDIGKPSDILLRKDLSFDLPKNFVKGVKRARPILQFLIRSRSDNSRLVVLVNDNPALDQAGHVRNVGKIALDREFDKHPVRSHYVTIDGKWFSPNSSNKIVFAINANSGDLIDIDEVVLFYQLEA